MHIHREVRAEQSVCLRGRHPEENRVARRGRSRWTDAVAVQPLRDSPDALWRRSDETFNLTAHKIVRNSLGRVMTMWTYLSLGQMSTIVGMIGVADLQQRCVQPADIVLRQSNGEMDELVREHRESSRDETTRHSRQLAPHDQLGAAK